MRYGRHGLSLVLAIGIAAFAWPASADEKPSLRAALLSNGSRSDLRIDGRLTEGAWVVADSISNLIMIEPEEGGVPAGRTVVKVLADADEIVIGLICNDADPAGILSVSKARDSELDEEDHVLVILNTFGDSRSGYVFAVNPGGSRFDGLVNAQGDDVNSNWDTVWEAATSVDSTGWCAELRLPIRSLGFRKGLSEWGLNVERHVQRLQETSRWSGAKRDYEIFQTSQAGILSGLPNFDLGVGLTVQPGVVSRAERTEPGTSRELTNDFSLDANQRLGSNLSATVTVNTDFGETDADVRQTNLSRFDVLFPERRTFFLDGADIFEFGLGLNVEDASIVPFFSRRIGLVVPEGEDEVAGMEVPVRGGGKVQGRIGKTNVGALVVATDNLEDLQVPRTTMGAMRVRQNVLSESSVGMIGTFGDPLGRPGSWLAGADFTYRNSHFREDKNLVMGVWGLTTAREGLGEDRRAYGGKVAYPNDRVDVGLTYFRVGEDFEPSLGFVQRTGSVLQGTAEYNARPDWSLIRRATYGLSYFSSLDVDGQWESYAASIRPFDWLLESGDRLTATVEPQGEHPVDSFDVFESQVRPVEIQPGSYHWTRYGVTGTLAPKRKISGEATWSWGGFYQGDLHTIEAAVALKPLSMLGLQLNGERNMATLPEGDFTQYLYGARTEIKISTRFQITNLVQYDNESRSLGSAARLRWTFHRLADLFVAYNHNMLRPDGGRRWRFESDRLLMKIQYAARL